MYTIHFFLQKHSLNGYSILRLNFIRLGNKYKGEIPFTMANLNHTITNYFF